MRRRLLPLILALITLGSVATACNGDGDNGDDGTGATTTAGDGAAPPTGPAELEANDQRGDGTTVAVASVTLPADGFLVVHADAGGAPGPVIGHTDVLAAGTSTDVEVPLDEPLSADATVWPMAHIDTNTNGSYDFDPPASTDDGPATFDNGDVAVVSIAYTVDGAAAGGGSGDAVTIEGFSFQPASIDVDAATTVTWTNQDGVTHTVTAGEPGAPADGFDSTIDSGQSADITFGETGTFAYFCKIHPSMTGEVTVS